LKRIGFTSGSFDPVTNGHLDVIARAARMVDELVVGIGVHPGKVPLFAADERIAMLEAETASIAAAAGCTIRIATFANLTVDAARDAGATLSFAACATAPTSTTRCRWPA
jgi:pantetheine-phosphate adenylyltransferase